MSAFLDPPRPRLLPRGIFNPPTTLYYNYCPTQETNLSNPPALQESADELVTDLAGMTGHHIKDCFTSILLVAQDSNYYAAYELQASMEVRHGPGVYSLRPNQALKPT